MPVPKRRHSCSRRNKRRAHDGLDAPASTLCSHCSEAKLPYSICPHCGYYNNKAVLKIKKAEK